MSENEAKHGRRGFIRIAGTAAVSLALAGLPPT